VKAVCPHGLRATHASLRRIVADEAVEKIGDALGHADHGKTAAAHYVGAAANVPVLRVLAGVSTRPTPARPPRTDRAGPPQHRPSP
jgi:hypothetical protein